MNIERLPKLIRICPLMFQLQAQLKLMAMSLAKRPGHAQHPSYPMFTLLHAVHHVHTQLLKLYVVLAPPLPSA